MRIYAALPRVLWSVLLASAAYGQLPGSGRPSEPETDPAHSGVSDSNRYSPGAIPYSAVGAADPMVTGRPFTADIRARKVQETSGGRVVYESHGAIARDVRGRVRREQFPSPKVLRADGGRTFVLSGVVISDPADGIQTRWSSRSAVSRTPYAAPIGPLDACERQAGETRFALNGETQRIELLGERMIEGISTRGCRVSTTIPAGALGNDEAFTVTDDAWSSEELQVTLLRIHRDPSRGEEERIELFHLLRLDPDPSLFEPPPIGTAPR